MIRVPQQIGEQLPKTVGIAKHEHGTVVGDRHIAVRRDYASVGGGVVGKLGQVDRDVTHLGGLVELRQQQ